MKTQKQPFLTPFIFKGHLFMLMIAYLVFFSCSKETVTNSGTFSYSTASATFVSGSTAGSSVAPTFSGGTAGTYSITSTAVTGVSINATTGVISWTGSIAAGTYAITVKNTNATATVTYTLTVTAAAVASSFSYSTTSATFVSGGTASSSVAPTFSGGTAGTYSITSVAVTGVSINATTGVISWTGAIAAGTYAITVKNTNATATVTYTLTVTAGVTSSFSYSKVKDTFMSMTGGTQSSVAPTFSGGTAGTYSITSGAITGVSINATTGVITYTGNIPTGSYTIGVSNSAASSVVNYTLVATALSLPVDFEVASPIVFSDFDGGNFSVVNNPNSTGNTSSKVAKMVKNANQTWGGSFFALAQPIDFSTKKGFTMDVYSPRVGAQVLLKVENATSGSINYEASATTTQANAWETLTFDYTSINVANSYSKIVIIFDNGTMGDGSANYTFYVDNITQTTISNNPNTFDVALLTNGATGRTWKLAAEANAFQVGPGGRTSPTSGDVWYGNNLSDVTGTRSCTFSDAYTFTNNGNMVRVVGAGSLFAESAALGTSANATNTCVAVNTFTTANQVLGDKTFTWTLDGSGNLTIDGSGAYMGLYKLTSDGAEENDYINGPAPHASYQVYSLSATRLVLYKTFANGNKWWFTFTAQ